MLRYPHINPIAFHIGPLQVHWYGLMYLLGFTLAGWLAHTRTKRSNSGWNDTQVMDLIFYCAVGVVVGGRIGYMLFYNFSELISRPWSLFQIWEGGMSFHGGLIGVIIAMWLFARRFQKKWVDVADFVVPLVPLGLAAGRVGNFINGELWGRITDMPWGMVFPTGGPLPRHPSQLYEFFLEGIVLFTILWIYSAKRRPPFAVSALFLLFYGLFRFTLEFFRQPDPQLGYLAWGWLTMGQVLSFPMILVGLAAWIWTHKGTK